MLPAFVCAIKYGDTDKLVMPGILIGFANPKRNNFSSFASLRSIKREDNTMNHLRIWQSGIVAVGFVLAFSASGLCDANSSDQQINLNDNKITAAERKLDQEKAKLSDKYAEEQAEQINKIPGAHVQASDLKESEVHKKGGFPNPLGWMLKPVTRLQEQSVRLQQEIMKLTGPIGTLQPAMLRLDKSMSSVQNQMSGMQGKIDNVNSSMSGMRGDIRGMQGDIRSMREDIAKLQVPVAELKKPVMDLRDPVISLAKPVHGVEGRLDRLENQLSQLRQLLALILTAIFFAAGLVAFGTPIAAIMIWRNRNKIVPTSKPEDIQEEHKLAAAGSNMGQELKSR
jgi:hypothetical protein